MLRLDWASPKITIIEFDSYLGNYLGANYDGILQSGDYLFVVTYDPLSSEQEQTIMDYVYALSSKARDVSVSSIPPFGAKSQVIGGVLKKFYARNTGLQYDLTTGSNDINFTIPFPWVKIIGIECIGGEILDTAELRVYDNALGTYSGVPDALLNQFGYTLNMAKDYYARSSPFDADLYQGMILKITYVSISDKRVGMNIIMNEVKS